MGIDYLSIAAFPHLVEVGLCALIPSSESSEACLTQETKVYIHASNSKRHNPSQPWVQGHLALLRARIVPIEVRAVQADPGLKAPPGFKI